MWNYSGFSFRTIRTRGTPLRNDHVYFTTLSGTCNNPVTPDEAYDLPQFSSKYVDNLPPDTSMYLHPNDAAEDVYEIPTFSVENDYMNDWNGIRGGGWAGI